MVDQLDKVDLRAAKATFTPPVLQRYSIAPLLLILFSIISSQKVKYCASTQNLKLLLIDTKVCIGFAPIDWLIMPRLTHMRDVAYIGTTSQNSIQLQEGVRRAEQTEQLARLTKSIQCQKLTKVGPSVKVFKKAARSTNSCTLLSPLRQLMLFMKRTAYLIPPLVSDMASIGCKHTKFLYCH